MMLLKSISVWILLMLAETLHGTFRILVLVPLLGDPKARQVSVFTGALLIFGITLLFIKWINPRAISSCLLIGAIWVLLTFIFEVVLGLFVFNMPWHRIAEDYDLLNGGLMPIGLLLMFFTPLVTAKWRGIILN